MNQFFYKRLSIVPGPLSLPPFPGIGPFSVAFSPLIFREAPYRGPSVREKERPGVEVGVYIYI